MKGGIAVVVVALLIGIGFGVYQVRATLTTINEVQDLFSGLVYYLEDHHGAMPESAEAFQAADFVERTPDGATRVATRAGDPFHRQAIGAEIADLSIYRVAWGADLTTLSIDRDGALRDAEGREVRLLGAGANVDTLRQFSRDLLKISREIRAAAASQPVPAP